jgi:hypothetical protein
MFYISQILQVARIGQGIQVYDLVFRVFVYKQSHHMRTYKTGAAGYDNRF